MMEESAAPAKDEEPAPPTRTHVGAKLRAIREQQGLSIGDVAQRLKYAPRQVQALEEGRYEALPSLTFQRGFVRGYAKLLGLDGGTLVAELEFEIGPGSGPNTEQLQRVAYTQPALSSRPTGQSAWRWIFAMAIVIVAIGGFSLHQWEPPALVKASSQPIPPAIPAPTNEPPRALDVPVPERSLPLPTPLIEQRSDASRVEGRLQFAFSGESWVEVRDAAGGVVLSGTFRNGAEQSAGGRPPFDVTVGNARLVKLTYRGAEVDLVPYTKVTVARLQLK